MTSQPTFLPPTASVDRRPARFRRRRAWIEPGALALLLCLSVIGAALTPTYAGRGLRARYWTNAGQNGGPARVGASAEFTVPTILRALSSPGVAAFSAEWTGYLFVDTPGRYVFALESDDGAEFEIDGRPGRQPFLETGTSGGMRTSSRTVVLARGAHPIRVRYSHAAGGGAVLDLTWTPPGSGPQALPEVLLSPDAPSAVSPAALRWRDHSAAVVVGVWPALLFYLPARGFVAWFLRQARGAGLGRSDRWALAGLGLTALWLCGWGVTWGLPGWFTWAADEIGAGHVEDGIAQWFSAGWFQLYAPLQYYILAIPVAVVQHARATGLLSVDLWSASVQLVAMRFGLGPDGPGDARCDVSHRGSVVGPAPRMVRCRGPPPHADVRLLREDGECRHAVRVLALALAPGLRPHRPARDALPISSRWASQRPPRSARKTRRTASSCSCRSRWSRSRGRAVGNGESRGRFACCGIGR